MSSNHYKEKALQATQNKIDRLKREADFFTRNKWKTIGFGALISILGPSYNSEPDVLGKSRNTLETSGMTYLELSISIAIFYTLAITIAHFAWKRQENKRLQFLEERKKGLQKDLKTFGTT